MVKVCFIPNEGDAKVFIVKIDFPTFFKSLFYWSLTDVEFLTLSLLFICDKSIGCLNVYLDHVCNSVVLLKLI